MNGVSNILLGAYLLLGPAAWIGLLSAMLLARSRMARLQNKRYDLPDPPPRVCVVVPAKDEGSGIRDCIHRIAATAYPGQWQIIAVNDRSADDTGSALDALAKVQTNLRVLHIRELPEGWLGKCNALHVATRELECDWILFVDSDVKVEPSALRDALALSMQRKYDALSITTSLECHTFIERLILPLAAGAWMIAFQVSLTNNDSLPGIAAANGQFFLIRRKAYEAVGGHAAVRDKIVEDVELMRLLKLRGFRTRLLFGPHLASTRMHRTWSQMLHGWGRIFSGTARRSPWRIIAAILFVIFSGLSVYPGLGYALWADSINHPFVWLIGGALHLVVMTGVLMWIYSGSGNRASYALIFPVGAAALLALLGYSLRLCKTGRFNWRGATIDLPTRPGSL